MLCHFYVDVLNPSFRRWKVSIQKFVNSSRHQGGARVKFPIGAWFSDISSDWPTVKCDHSFVNQIITIIKLVARRLVVILS